jgi:hypothetical protein
MPLWSKSGQRPKYLAAADRRNIIATPEGWVRRIQYTGTGGIVRKKDEILVHITNLSGLVSMGNPDIVELYVANSSGGTTIKRNLVNKVNVVYSEPISIATSPSILNMNVANVAGGSAKVAVSDTNKANIVNANNTLVFSFTPTVAGTYKIQAQTLTSNAAHKVYGIYGGASETANTVISASVSNTLSTFVVG